MNSDLTPQQEKRLEKLARVMEHGDTEMLALLFEIEEKLDDTLGQVDSKIEEVKDSIPDMESLIEQAKGKDGADSVVPGPKGDKGDKGDQGEPGKDGKDGVDGKDGKDGKPADEEYIIDSIEKDLPTLGTAIRDSLELLSGEERLDAKAIKNLPDVTKAIGQRAGWGAHPLVIQDDGVVVDKVARTINFTGGTVTRTPSGVITVPIGGGSATWGSITGTLSDQTDLQTALDDKVPYTGATSDVNIGTHEFIGHSIKGDASDGLLVEANNGTDVGLFGAGNTANVTWYGNHNFSTATQDTIAGFTGAGKTLGSLPTATYPSLTELSYVKGVTSAVQTQIDSKVPTTRTISTTAPLSGGGDLSADRTITTSMSTNKLIGRSTAGTGVMEEISIGTGLSLSGGTLSNTVTDTGITQLTGDVTAGPGSGSQAATIANSAVTNAKMANMAQSTFKGRAFGAGTGAPVDLTATQATAILNNFVGDSGLGGTKGLVPAPAAGDNSKYLKGDGTWGTISSSGDVVGPASATDNAIARFDSTTGKLIQNSGITISDGATGSLSGTNTGDQTITLTGDVTGSGTGSFAATIANDAVTNAKLANVSTSTIKGRITASTGDPEDLTPAQAREVILPTQSASTNNTYLYSTGVAGSEAWGSPLYAVVTQFDFGSTPVRQKLFTYTNTLIGTSSHVQVFQQYRAATGKSLDENEFDQILFMSAAPTSGSVSVYATSLTGPVKGKFRVLVYINNPVI